MNYVKDVCTKVLGLDWENNKSSEFTTNVDGENPIKHCYIDGYGFLNNNNIGSLNISLTSIVNGAVTFKKETKLVPFYDCPEGEPYYYVNIEGLIMHEINDNETFDFMCKKLNNMFKTKDLPPEQIDSIAESLKGE